MESFKHEINRAGMNIFNKKEEFVGAVQTDGHRKHPEVFKIHIGSDAVYEYY